MPADGFSPSRRTTSALCCRELRVGYSDVAVLRDLSLEVAPGEIVALLGASGSGKSTLLHTVAGLIRPTTGDIWVSGRQVAGERHATPPEQRDIGMVFQSFALWPHLSVLDTVAYPARRAGHSRPQAAILAGDLLTQLGIGQLARRRPAELSGGEQQRVGLARALARNAGLYLLDEPTAHLDTHLRGAFQQAVLARQHDTGAAVIYATHDAGEALAIADRVALMIDGRLVQAAAPTVVYSQPASRAAAELTGSCAVLQAHVRSLPGGRLSADFGDGASCVIGDGASCVTGDGGGGIESTAPLSTMMVRPGWVHVGGPMTGQVRSAAFRGTHTDYRLATRAGTLEMTLPGPPRYTRGEVVPLGLSQAWLLDGTDTAGSGALPHPNAEIAPG